MKIFGNAITIIERVCYGESFIIVRNNTPHAIRHNPRVIEIIVHPSVCLPSVLQPREVVKHDTQQIPAQSNCVNKLERKKYDADNEQANEEGHDPRTFIVWNVNGLSTRIYNKD